MPLQFLRRRAGRSAHIYPELPVVFSVLESIVMLSPALLLQCTRDNTK